jgi:hypothetical protein
MLLGCRSRHVASAEPVGRLLDGRRYLLPSGNTKAPLSFQREILQHGEALVRRAEH